MSEWKKNTMRSAYGSQVSSSKCLLSRIVVIILVCLQLVNLSQSRPSNMNEEDDELGKTMDRINYEELNFPNQQVVQDELSTTMDHKDNNNLSRIEGDSSLSARYEEFGGQSEPSELDHQYISVVNNQSNIVVSESVSDFAQPVRFETNQKHNLLNGTSNKNALDKTGFNESLIMSVPSRIDKLEGQTNGSERTIGSVKLSNINLKQINSSSDEVTNNILANKARRRDKKKKKVASNEMIQLQRHYQLQQPKIISYSASNINRQTANNPMKPTENVGLTTSQLVQPAFMMKGFPASQLNPHKPTKIWASGRVESKSSFPIRQEDSFMFDASLIPPSLVKSNLFSSALNEQRYLAKERTNNYFKQPENLPFTQSQSPLQSDEDKWLFPKALQTSESLTTSSSQPSSEFETALKQQQRDPIVASDPNGYEPSESQSSPTSGYSNEPEVDSSEDDEEETTTTPSATAHNATSNGIAKMPAGELHRDELATMTGNSSPSRPSSEKRPDGSGGRGLAKVGLVTQLESNGSSTTPSTSGRVKVDEERELLVGPFRSESEAPTTITLSGIVYQKSGTSSTSFIKRKPVQEGTVLSSSPLPTRPIQHLPLQVAGLEKITSSWPHPTATSYPAHSTPFDSINDILSTADGSQSVQNAATFPNNYALFTSLASQGAPGSGAGALRLSQFPLSAGSLLSALANEPSALQLSSISLLNPSKTASEQFASATSKLNSDQLSDNQQLESAGSASSGALVQQQQQAESPMWMATSSSANKKEQYYLGSLASESYQHNARQKGNGPIVIVQKDVKPVKYHLLRAYLKLRRLLRPFEATYVFPNDRWQAPALLGRRRSNGKLEPMRPTKKA